MGGEEEGGAVLGWFVATPSLVDSKTRDLFLYQKEMWLFGWNANISLGG